MADQKKGKPAPQPPAARPGEDTPPQSEHLGGTERDVVPTAPPSADTLTRREEKSAADQIDPNDELTPG